jgi:hypothetical protein
MAEPATKDRDNSQKQFSRQTINLALEWVAGEISTPEARGKFGGISTNSTVYRMGAALRQAHREGRIKVVSSQI